MSARVLVTGGTGFVGPAVVEAIREAGHEPRVLVRHASRRIAAGVETVTGDVTDAESLRRAVDGCTHVVHLVAIIKAGRRDFERVMMQATSDLAAAAREAGVRRFVLMSALGVTEETRTLVPYYEAKWSMEQAVAGSGVEHVILRPSFVFGPGGGALRTFVRQVRLLPVVTVIGNGRARVQPIWRGDVAACFARALELPAAANRTFELGGPDVVTWDELYRTIARVLGKRRALVHVPAALARAGALATQRLPGAPLTADQVAMIEAGDNVATGPSAADVFGLAPLGLEEQIRRSLLLV